MNMRHKHRMHLDSPPQERSNRWAPFLCGALLAGMFVGLSTLGSASNSGSGNNPMGAGSGGDETVGTLPSMGGGSMIHFVRRVNDSRPAVCLEGTLEDLMDTVLQLDGSGDCSVSEIDPFLHVLRLEFHGAVRFQLDRGFVHLGGVTFGLSVPSAFRNGHLTAQWAGRSSASTVLQTGTYALPLASMDALGQLSQAPLALVADSPTQNSVALIASSHDGVMVLTQRR